MYVGTYIHGKMDTDRDLSGLTKTKTKTNTTTNKNTKTDYTKQL